MSLSAAVLLGVIQGLTEFLPVSSSGHLVLAQHFVPGFTQPGVLFDIVLHLGTLLAVILYFRKEIVLLVNAVIPGRSAVEGRRLVLLLVVGTAPAVLAALAAGDVVERTFTQLAVVGGGLLLTALALLFSARFAIEGRDLRQMSAQDAVMVGFFQSVALFPGVSRSGSTIVGGLLRGLSRDTAARFSFLLSVPAILAATVYELPNAKLVSEQAAYSYAAGFVTAFAVGYASIGVVLRSLARKRFHLFGYYCLVVGGLILVYIAYALP